MKGEATVTPYGGLKASSRFITSRDSGSDKIHFVVGSATIGKTNEIQIIEYDDLRGGVQCIQTLDHPDEIWSISCCPNDPDRILTAACATGSRSLTVNMYKIPAPDSNMTEKQPLETVGTFTGGDADAKRALFWPKNAERCIVSGSSSISIFDVSRPDAPLLQVQTSDGSLGTTISDPHTENLVAGCCGGAVRLWDMNSGQVVHELGNAHSPAALDVSFNENKAWWVATGGSDGLLRCWDMRVGRVECEFRASSHWVTRVIPSVSHEQLILTAGTDSKVRVFNAKEFAFQNEGGLPNGEAMRPIRNDSSVYSACWSVSPWVFASVSYRGQVNVCQLPNEIVEPILMGDSD